MSHRSRSRWVRPAAAVTAAGVVLGLVTGTIASAQAAPVAAVTTTEAPSANAPSLNVSDGQTLEGTFHVVADASVENDPVVGIAVDDTPLETAVATVGTAHFTFDMGGNGTEARYHNYITVNDHTDESERVYFPNIAGGGRGDLTFPGAWLHPGNNTITVTAGWAWVDSTATTSPSYETLPNGQGGRCKNYDDWSQSSNALSLLGVVADGELNAFSYSFGDGTCQSGTKLLTQDLTFVLSDSAGTGGLTSDLDTTTLTNGTHTITATTESGATTVRTVEVNNAPPGSAKLTPADGAVLNGTKPVNAALPVGSDATVESIAIDGVPAETGQMLAPGTSTFTVTVKAGNSAEARYNNEVVVNGNRLSLGGDYGVSGNELATIKVPNRFLKLGDNVLEVQPGDINSGSGASLCANRDDFTLTGPDLAIPVGGTVTAGTHYVINTTTNAKTATAPTGNFGLGDGTCGQNKIAQFHFTVAGAPTTNYIETLGSANEQAHLRMFVGGNGTDTGYENKLLINGIPMDMGVWEKETADVSFPNEWLVPGLNTIEIVAGIAPSTVTADCPSGNFDDFTTNSYELLPVGAKAAPAFHEIAETNNVSFGGTYNIGETLGASFGDGTCLGSYTPTLRKVFTFEVTAQDGSALAPKGLRYDLDTTEIADGQHTLAAVVGDKTSTRHFTVDNTAPVIANSTPAQGAHLRAKVALDVELEDASGVAGTPVLTLDGNAVEEGDSIGEGLTAGDHTLAVTAVDSLGNQATRTVTFSTASIPSSPTDVSTTIGGTANAPTATLSAKLPGEAGVALTASFTAAEVVTPESGYQGEAAEVPTTLDVAHDDAVDVSSLQPIDGRSVETPSSGQVVFQRYDLNVGSSADVPTLRWEGVIDPTRLVSLRVWHPTKHEWVLLTSSRGKSAANTVLSSPLTAGYRDGNVVHVMVTGEDPFADDLSPHDASAKDDKDHFEDPSSYDFSIAHFTDTQYLTEGAAGGTYDDWDGVSEASDVETEEERAIWEAAWTATTHWISDNKDGRKIAYTAHTGDVIENDYYNPDAVNGQGNLLRPGLHDEVETELQKASEYMKILDDGGVVNQVIAGNHDDQLGAETGPTSRFSRTFSADRYYDLATQGWPAGAEFHTMDETTDANGTVVTRGEDSQNNYVLFSAGGLDFVAVGLSYGVTPAEAHWADSIFKRYKDRNGILLSHDYLSPSANPDGRGAGFSNPDGSMLYKQVVEDNSNVFLVLAGHEHGVGTNLKTDIGGTVDTKHNVVELLADYQFYTVRADKLWPGLVDGSGNIDLNGDGKVDHKATDRLQFGASFLRLLQFDVARSEMHVDTYSPYFDEFGATPYDIRQDGSATTPRYNGSEDNMTLPVDLSSRKTSFSTDSLAVLVPGTEIGSHTVQSGDTATAEWTGLKASTSYAWIVSATSESEGVAYAEPVLFRTGKAAPTISAEAVEAEFGQDLHILASINDGVEATGTVTAKEGDTVLGTAEVSFGTADIAIAGGLPEGAHTVTLEYAGDAANEAATASVQVTITAAPEPVEPAVASAVADDQLFSFKVGADGALWQRSRSDETNAWSAWSGQGVPAPGATITKVATAVSDGQLFVIAIDQNGQVYKKSRSDATNTWSGWTGLTMPAGIAATGVATGVSDGALFTVVTGSDGNAYKRSRAEGSTWSGWSALTAPAGVSFESVSTAVSDGNLFAVTTAADGRLYKLARNEASNTWSPWSALTTPAGVRFTSTATAVSDGQVFVLATAENGTIYKVARPDGGSWSSASTLSLPAGVTFTGVSAGVSDGQLFALGLTADGQLLKASRSDATNAWSTWSAFAAPATGVTVLSTSVALTDGELFVLAGGSDGNVYKLSRNETSDVWSPWASNGAPVVATPRVG